GRIDAIGQLELAEDGGVVHPAMIAMRRPPGKCRAAHHSEFLGPSRLPIAAREEPEQRKHENHDENDPENPHTCVPPLPLSSCRSRSPLENNEKPAGSGTGWPKSRPR